MKKTMLILLLFVTLGCATHQPLPDYKWTKTDTTLQVTYTALHIMDWSQTLHIARNPATYYEDKTTTNHFIRGHPSKGRVNSYFTFALLLNTAIAKWLPHPYRTITQSIFVIEKYDAVQSNRDIGIGINLHF